MKKLVYRSMLICFFLIVCVIVASVIFSPILLESVSTRVFSSLSTRSIKGFSLNDVSFSKVRIMGLNTCAWDEVAFSVRPMPMKGKAKTVSLRGKAARVKISLLDVSRQTIAVKVEDLAIAIDGDIQRITIIDPSKCVYEGDVYFEIDISLASQLWQMLRARRTLDRVMLAELKRNIQIIDFTFSGVTDLVGDGAYLSGTL